MEEQKAVYVRKKGVVDSKFQTHYLSVWLVVTMSLLVCCGGLYWYLRVNEGPQLSNQARKALDQLVVGNFVFIILLSALMGCYAVLHSHHVAGPAYRIRESLRRVLADDLNFTITLRSGDYLQEIVLQLNSLIGRLRERDEKLAAFRSEFERLRQQVAADGSSEAKRLAESADGLLRGLNTPSPAPAPPAAPAAPDSPVAAK